MSELVSASLTSGACAAPVSERSPTLSLLALEGLPVLVRSESTGACNNGIITGSKITVPGSGKELSVAEFANSIRLNKVVGESWKHYWRNITLPSLDDVTLLDRFEMSDTGEGKRELERVQAKTQQKYKVLSSAPVVNLMKALQPTYGRNLVKRYKRVYRACRPAENPAAGLQLAPGHRTPTAGAFIKQLNDHVRTGTSTGDGARRPVISTTTSFNTALWWSFYGVQPIASVDVSACVEEGVAMFDLCGDASELLYAGVHTNFAKSSREVLITDVIPPAACAAVNITWEPNKAFSTTTFPIKDRKAAAVFPKLADICPANIRVIRVLENGCTRPLLVEFPNNPKLAGRQFVMKRAGREADCDERQILNEFVANMLYLELGAAVPRAALYCVNVHVMDPGLVPDWFCQQRVYLLLTEFIPGGDVDLPAGTSRRPPQRVPFLAACTDEEFSTVQQQLCDSFVVDVAVGNFDVAGELFSNIVVDASRTKAYRVDLGGCLRSTPGGGSKEFKSSDAAVKHELIIMAGTRRSTRIDQKPRWKYTATEARTALFGGILAHKRELAERAAHFCKLLRGANGRLCELPAYPGMNNDMVTVAERLQGIVRVILTDGAVLLRNPTTPLLLPPAVQRGGGAAAEAPAAATPGAAQAKANARKRPITPTAYVSDSDEGEEVAERTPAPPPGKRGARGGVGAAGATPAPPPVPAPMGAPPSVAMRQITIHKRSGWKLPVSGLVTLDGRAVWVVDVTSKSETAVFRNLSPFTPVMNIPLDAATGLPGLSGMVSHSAEGAWQGLKVFARSIVPKGYKRSVDKKTGAESFKDKKGVEYSAVPPEAAQEAADREVELGVDRTKMNVRNMKSLKRPANRSGRGEVLGHFQGEGMPLLKYVEARQRIYLPLYKWVLEQRLQTEVRHLADLARKHDIVLLDYYVNADVNDTRTALSHAAVLRQYLQDNNMRLR